MSTTSKIEWTDKTWNPVRGCSVISPGCVNCYAMKQAHRFSGAGKPYEGLTKQTKAGPQWTGLVRTVPSKLREPFSWKTPQRVFVNSMSDLFHEDVPFDFIDQVFDVMWRTPQHTYQVLTKRPGRMVDYIQERASRRRHGWIDRDRTPLHPGEFIHYDDIRMRNMCGHVGADYACNHAYHKGLADSCDSRDCPIASRVGDRASLEKIGVAHEHEFDQEGYADDSEWMELTDRPVYAMPGNVWLGFSAEDQRRFNERARQFQALRWILGPHFTLFASLEPLIGPIDTNIPADPAAEDLAWSPLSQYDFGNNCTRPYLDWLIVGLESGPQARPGNADWARDLIGQCAVAGVACFMKQLGAGMSLHIEEGRGRFVRDGEKYIKLTARKGGDMAEWPADLRVRQFPEARA